MAESVFRTAGELFTPTGHARGPWDPGALHGGAPAALITSLFEQATPGAELPFARLHFSFLRPVPMAQLDVSTAITRPGRRVQELGAEIKADGLPVCRASALRLQQVPGELPPSALEVLEREASAPLEGPEHGREVRFALENSSHDSFAASAMEMRFLHGNPLDTSGTGIQAGSAVVWMRLRHPLLPDLPLTPLVRLVAAADFGNGVSAALPFLEYLFINADLAITLERRPQGEWIGLDARTLLRPDGVGWARSVLHDQQGRVGVATQALVVQRR